MLRLICDFSIWQRMVNEKSPNENAQPQKLDQRQIPLISIASTIHSAECKQEALTLFTFFGRGNFFSVQYQNLLLVSICFRFEFDLIGN